MTFKEFKEQLFANSIHDCYKILETNKDQNFYSKCVDILDKENERLTKLSKYENFLKNTGNTYIAGTDEAGRGPLAGPIVAGAVILDDNELLFGINDSKKLTAEKRDKLFDKILNNCIAASIHTITNKQIDEINIANADIIAMKMSIEKLSIVPDHVLTDAFFVEGLQMNQTPLKHGDALSISIAAASIIAKVTRDRMMDEYDKIYPHYGFSNNKGYGTKEHINAIKKYGICPIHRKTFVKNFIQI
ncbi:MAG TPA: ribonuclease HII [Clostridia bacterium]|nr:MAG: Ribonuclease HII [Firmicutes bacterium ADurb.Bin146]HOD93675.1 ribonuclease HII [Clostridia bacterium]